MGTGQVQQSAGGLHQTVLKYHSLLVSLDPQLNKLHLTAFSDKSRAADSRLYPKGSWVLEEFMQGHEIRQESTRCGPCRQGEQVMLKLICCLTLELRAH